MRSSSEGDELRLVQDAIQGQSVYHSWPEVIRACSQCLAFDFILLLLCTHEAKIQSCCKPWAKLFSSVKPTREATGSSLQPPGSGLVLAPSSSKSSVLHSMLVALESICAPENPKQLLLFPALTQHLCGVLLNSRFPPHPHSAVVGTVQKT